MKNIEIPHPEDRDIRYRIFEILPGFISWTLLLTPIILSFINPTATVFFIIGYMLMWFAKSVGLNVRAIQGYRTLRLHQRLPWAEMLKELGEGKTVSSCNDVPKWHQDNLTTRSDRPNPINPEDMFHAIIIAAYNESREVLEPTVLSVLDSAYDMKKVILVIAYEGRDGAKSEQASLDLVKKYGDKFKHAMAVKHPLTAGEVRGKGGNITYAGRQLEKYVKDNKIKPLNVVVTTLDSDNRPHKQYLNALTYLYSMCHDPVFVSFQPIPMFTNNIWDAPAPMRVIATGNSFWNIVLSLRPHMLRNFSSHAQSLQTLIDTDFWSVRTIVEDGHQFWRTYFRYDGKHDVYPLYLSYISGCGAVPHLYKKTLKAQFIQIRRWAWGASDIAYVAYKGFFQPNKVPRMDLILKFFRLLEGHVSWASAPLILALAAFIPSTIDPENFAANQLPLIASRIQTIALAGIFVTLFLSIKMLPPRPKRYKAHRNIFMVAQWVLLPFTTIAYSSMAALYSQTRLLLKIYIGKFDTTDKAVVTEGKQKVL